MSVRTEILFNWAIAWRDAPRGTKGVVIDQACAELGLAASTLHRKFNELLIVPQRKRRSDAGTTALTRHEATIILAVVMEHMRKNGKRIKRFSTAIKECRTLGLIAATRTDPITGEVTELSVSAITKALRIYNMHPDQVLRPAPAVRLSSDHPNDVWQIDASRCIMYWLPKKGHDDNGLRIQTEKEFYKNKPANQIKAIKDSIWRYNVTDHKSGWIFTDYVTGGESAENIVNCFLHAVEKRDNEAFYGVPKKIMMDLGSANTSATFMNLLKALRIRVLTNKPGNPRAKGQVEKSQDIVERNFESMLKTLPPEQVRTLEQIRQLAAQWRKFFNGTEVMARHGMTRDAAWLHITPSQLVLAPDTELMRQAANGAPVSRLVSDYLTISFQGKEYDVSAVPGISNGEKLFICQNVFAKDSAQAIIDGVDGYDEYIVLPEVKYDKFGQQIGAPKIGDEYASHAETPAQLAAKEVEMLAMGASSIEEAQAKRKAKTQFLGGKYDPFEVMRQAVIPLPIPRSGTEHEMAERKSHVLETPLTHIKAAKLLRAKLENWNQRYYQWMVKHYPDGILASDIDTVAAEMREALAPNLIPLKRALGA